MERSSAARTAGVVMREVTLGDQTYLLSKPFRVRKAADEEAVILARRMDLFPAIAKACLAIPEGERAAWRRDYIEAMICGFASPREWITYARSLWELAFRFWHVLDDKHHDGRNLLDGVAWAHEIVSDPGRTQAEMDSLEIAIQFVSQDAPLGESSGSPAQATPPTADQSMVAGQQ